MEKILITGARSGIINNVIDTILNDDYYIYLTVATTSQLESVKAKYKDYKNIKCLKLDVTNKKDYKNIENLDIDIFISNAAIGEGGSISEIPFEKVRENYEVNVFKNFELLQIIIKQMLEKNKGKIIIISSLASIIPIDFLGVYASTKASISMLATTLKNELKLLKTNVKIKLIEPGLYHTGFNQIMLENKYDWMIDKSYFKKVIPKIRKRENLMISLLEKKNLNSITNTIIKAIKSNNKKFIYQAPFFQKVGARLYKIFK